MKKKMNFDKCFKCFKRFGLKVDTFENIGSRNYMEDRHNISKISDHELLLTVCDGHGGESCAQFAIEKFPNYFQQSLHHTRKTAASAMKWSLKKTSTEWDRISLGKRGYPKNENQKKKIFEKLDKKHFETKQLGSGTTLLACYLNLQDRKATVLNLGDSRAQWQLKNLVCATKDHVPELGDLSNEFHKWIEDDEGTPRINGDLAVGRALGDNTENLVGVISREASVDSFSFKNTPLFLIMASDGFWDENPGQQTLENIESWKQSTFKRKPDDNVTIITLFCSST
jgi:serine/threonine protein phosphatase PrpC